MAEMDKCDFCHEQVYERKGGLQVFAFSDNFEETLRQASKRKFVCPTCSSIFCLECGNKKGYELKTGSTHCPKCGTQVL
jgi:DNA-directed RNA polymerase subunit RPC12/RpoP